MIDARLNFLNIFPFRTDDDRLFVESMCRKFPHVNAGYKRLSHFEPDQWLGRSVKGLDKQIRSGWKRIGITARGIIQTVAQHESDGMKLAFMIATTPKYNARKIAKMFAVHDLAEGIIGDFTPLDKITKAEKFRLEAITLDIILTTHPDAKEIKDLWHEFEDGKTPDAQIANDIDILELLMQAQYYQYRFPPMRHKLAEFWEWAQKKIKTPEGEMLFNELNEDRAKPHVLKHTRAADFVLPWNYT